MSVNASPPSASFAVSPSRPAGGAIVTSSGELDLESADELVRAVHHLWARGTRRVIVDLQPLEFMDSSGLRALLVLRETAGRDGHELSLRRGQPVVQRIFELTGTRRLFDWQPR